MTEQPQPTVWDNPAFAKAWNETYGLDMARAPIRAGLVFPLIAEHIGDFSGKTLADFGCGNGNLIRHFASENFAHWAGVDGGTAILQSAVDNTTDPRITYERQDLCARFTSAAKADVVTSVFVVEEIPIQHLRTYFENIAHNLKPDGQALIFTQHPTYAMMESHKALAEGRANTKFEGHQGYFDTAPSTYALQILNQQDGQPAMAAHHHKPLMAILNEVAAAGLAPVHTLETPSGIGTLEALKSHTPSPADFPRFLFLALRNIT